MMSMSFIVFSLLTLLIGTSTPGQMAKRAAPEQVPSVEHNGIRYTADGVVVSQKTVGGWRVVTRRTIATGFIEAIDTKTNKRLWKLRVYKTRYDPRLEKDVQDVFITSLEISGNALLVVNERDERYEVDLKSRKVTRKI